MPQALGQIDGLALVVGGGLTFKFGSPVFIPELFDPDTETWTLMAPHQAGRMYHSTALLLPDGRVLSAGGGICGTCRCRIEEGLDQTDAVKPKERRHLTEAELADGWRMACQTFVTGDVSVSWPEVRKP